ncbi:MAG: DUF99 family protein [Thermoanaerobaculia bacterium]|nr:DUF99 family protein [Thermoanaerobaculia bacterium]
MRARKPISQVVAFDDAPFARAHRGDVAIVGVVFAGNRLDGVLTGKVRRDGANATREILRLLTGSRFAPQIQLVMLQGIAMAGFNVVDAFAIHRELGVPLLVVARHEPDRDAVRDALLGHVRGGARKWRMVELLGAMEPLAGVWVQRVGIERAEAERVVKRFATHSKLPEPLRVAHVIAGGIGTGESRGRA